MYNDKLLCYFDGETVSFPFPLLGKVLSALGRQTSSCTAGGKTQLLQMGLSVFLMEKTDPSAQPAGCWQHDKQEGKS